MINGFETRSNNINNNDKNNSQPPESDFLFTFGVPYVDKSSHVFAKRLRP